MGALLFSYALFFVFQMLWRHLKEGGDGEYEQERKGKDTCPSSKAKQKITPPPKERQTKNLQSRRLRSPDLNVSFRRGNKEKTIDGLFLKVSRRKQQN